MRHKLSLFIFLLLALAGILPATLAARNNSRVEKIFPKKKKIKPPELTRAQMYEDFDFLIVSITNTFCRIQVKKKLMDQDIVADLRILRRKIARIKTYRDFVLLVNRALYATQDGHDYILYKGLHNWKMLLDADHKSRYAKLSVLHRDYLPEYYNYLPVIYFQGEYRVYNEFDVGKVKVQVGDVLTSVDNTPIHKYVRQLRFERRLMWDPVYHRFYGDQFYRSTTFNLKDKLKLIFKDSDGKLKKVLLDKEVTLDFTRAHYHPAREYRQVNHTARAVRYIQEIKTLYIRASSLRKHEEMIREMLDLKGEDIEKIVFDFRDSPGGFVDFFPAFIQHIYQDNFSITDNIAMKVVNTEFKDPEGPRNKSGKIIFDKQGEVKVPLLGGESFQVFTHKLDFKAESRNMVYEGKVYVLLNTHTFSSPTIAQYQALKIDRVVTVGQPSGFEQGEARGAFYEVFVLPHSKMAYQIVNGIDLSKYDTIEDLFDNRVELPVDYTWEETLHRMYYPGDIYGPEYLLKHDPLMRAVLKQPLD